MSDTKIYNSLAEFYRSMNLEIQQDFDFTIHSLDLLHGQPPVQSPFFRTNYHAFLLIEAGKGHYTIDAHTFPLKAGSFYFTNPGHLKSFFIEENWQGFILSFSESFLKEHYPLQIEQEFPFLYQETIPVMYLPNDIFADLKVSYDVLHKEYISASAFKRRIIGGHLVSLLFKTKELLTQYQAKIETENRGEVITAAFRQLLNKNLLDVLQEKVQHIWAVTDYADYLYIHPNHLSTTVKTETGKTVKQWIDEKIHTEARTLLLHSDKTVAEVAYTLYFSDTSNFSRFFKKMEGQTPGQFRKS
ncbi:MAG: AraC family transcriptional regulator [Bacteroidota bacterium]